MSGDELTPAEPAEPAEPAPEQPDELQVLLTGSVDELQAFLTAAAERAAAGADPGPRAGELTPDELRPWTTRLRADAARTRSCLRSLHEYYARRGNPTAQAVFEERNLLEWQLAVIESLRREACDRGIPLPRWRGARGGAA